MIKTDQYTLVSGIGYGKTELNAFDNALHAAGVGNYNLIKVSSILPPMSKEENFVGGVAGGILPIAYGHKIEHNSGHQIVATVAVGIPQNSSDIGVIMEYSDYGDQQHAEDVVKEMVKEAMCNRNIEIKEIKCISSCCYVNSSTDFCCVFSGIALW